MGGTKTQIPFGNDKPKKSGMPVLGWLVLALTAAMSLLWSHHKLLEQDEIFSLQTDRVNSLAEVLRIQRLYPISLEPPPYHVLAHAAMAVFGPTAFALRLPAFLGYLLMQVCLFFFVRNLVGGVFAERAGLVAMAIPGLTWTLYYSAEGRPYGLLLGSYALAALCWQMASRREDGRADRIWPLVGLAAALVLTINVHFYGVLLLVVICGAEAVRTLLRRRLDWPLIGAIAVGVVSVAATLPYVKASNEFKRHYYAGPVSAHMLTQPYRQMLLDYTSFPKSIQAVCMLVLVLCAVLVAISCIRLVRSRSLAATKAEGALVLLLVLLPVFAFVLGRFVTHALEVRHSIGAIVGLSALIAITLLPALRNRQMFGGVMVVMLIGIVVVNALRIHDSIRETAQTMAALTLSPTQRATVDAQPDRNIYFQDLGAWEVASQYEPNADLRSRLVLVYSYDNEMRYEQHDTMYLTATHTQHFSPQPILSYDVLQQTPGEHTFATFHSGWNWTPQAFQEEGAQVDDLGPAFGGELDAVRFLR
jgi:hypothetical protein